MTRTHNEKIRYLGNKLWHQNDNEFVFLRIILIKGFLRFLILNENEKFCMQRYGNKKVKIIMAMIQWECPHFLSPFSSYFIFFLRQRKCNIILEILWNSWWQHSQWNLFLLCFWLFGLEKKKLNIRHVTCLGLKGWAHMNVLMLSIVPLTLRFRVLLALG